MDVEKVEYSMLLSKIYKIMLGLIMALAHGFFQKNCMSQIQLIPIKSTMRFRSLTRITTQTSLPNAFTSGLLVSIHLNCV